MSHISQKACRVMLDHIPDESYVEALPGTKMGEAEESEGDGIAGSSADESPEQKKSLKEEATSLKHLLTHLPFNKYCAACQRAKMSNAKSERGGGIDGHEYKTFGEHVTADTWSCTG